MKVLDLGNEPDYWRLAPQQPAKVVVVNLIAFDVPESHIEAVQAEACRPPVEVIRDQYDLVVSNSLFEHAGGHAARAQLADVFQAASERHGVQTP